MSLLENSHTLQSDGGLYDISFFAASVGHSVAQSRDIFARLSGGMLSTFADEWSRMSKSDRDAYLLETHEVSHHALMFSSPAGVLLWRLNQVLVRDISFIFSQAPKLGFAFPQNRPPGETLNDPGWQAEFEARADIPSAARAYILHVVRSLSDVLRVRSVFFDRDGATTNAGMTFGELIDLLERTFVYLQDRCEVRFVTKWTTRLPRDTKVFPEDKGFNVTDIAEAHAIAGELFALRALQDMEAFERRREAAAQGPFGAAFKLGAAATAAANTLGISPHQLQLVALVACASALDVADDKVKELTLEDALPWWRFTNPQVLQSSLIIEAMRNCMTLVNTPLIGQGSKWIQFRDFEPGKPVDEEAGGEKLSDLVTSLQSLGLDLQIRAIHNGANLNFQYLVTKLVDSNPNGSLPKALKTIKRVTDGQWREQLYRSISLIEYADEFFCPGEDLDQIYKPGHPLRQFRVYLIMKNPGFQLLAHILNGALPRTLYAAYARRLIPRSDVLRPKFAKLVGEELATSMCNIVANLFERGGATGLDLAHLNVLPEYVPAKLYIC